MDLIVSFLYLLLHIAVIIFVAFVLLWLITSPQVLGMSLDANVLKWGRIIVVLLCIIAVVVWLLSLWGVGPGLLYTPRPILR
jgi:hypothetical protein